MYKGGPAKSAEQTEKSRIPLAEAQALGYAYVPAEQRGETRPAAPGVRA